MNFTQIRKLNELWQGRRELEERVERLETAIMTLAEATDERMMAIEFPLKSVSNDNHK